METVKKRPAKRKRKKLIEVFPTDILFECPACGKSMVIDLSAQGMIVDCDGCGINVIVPPKPPTDLTQLNGLVDAFNLVASSLAETGLRTQQQWNDLVALENRQLLMIRNLRELNSDLASIVHDIQRKSAKGLIKFG